MPSFSHTRETLSHTTRAALRRMWTRGTLTLIGFIALAAAFWLAVSLNETYDVEIAVPLQLSDVPGNVVITTELPEELRITLRDKGIRLLPYLYGAGMKPIVISFRDHTQTSGRCRINSSELLPQLAKQIANPTQIIQIKPDTLEYYFNFGASKRVPVRFDGNVQCQAGYFVAQTKLKPEFVTVYAPQSVLDTLRYVSIRQLHVTGARDTVQRKQPIATMRGMKAVPAMVNVSLICDRLTEKTVRVPIHAINFPGSRVLRTFPSMVDLTFKVGVSQYERIGAQHFVVALSYEDLIATNNNKVSLNVRSIPDGVSDIRITPATVDFVIETIPEEEDSVK
ncbi:MAG: YbbR-like domain-containing protein [Bacteroidaceae bacterium]|nr:YbbR-like domain-containing protein [Bacteroidaceae bacterium]